MSSPCRSLAVAALVVLATLGPAVIPGAAAAGAGPDAGQFAQAVDADSVRMAVALQADGDATWTVTYRVRLDDENETEAFESLRRDVESDPENFTDRFGRRMRSTARAAENATGREMGVENVTVDARTQELGRTYGILEYTFEWTGFAVVDGDTVTAGDALAGLFLDGGTTLVFTWPEGFGPSDVRPAPDPDVGGERSVGWAGPEDFGRDEPRVVVQEGAARPGDGGGLPTAALVAGLLLATVGLGAVALWYRRRGGPVVPAGGGDGAAQQPDEPPEELLSNEEKVLKLVRERGGRVKQQEVVEALDWTEAKTSQVVRDLREEGALEGFRLGRENVLRLPEEGGEDAA